MLGTACREIAGLLNFEGDTYSLYGRDPSNTQSAKKAQNVLLFNPGSETLATIPKNKAPYGVFYITAAQDNTVESWIGVFKSNLKTYRKLKRTNKDYVRKWKR